MNCFISNRCKNQVWYEEKEVGRSWKILCPTLLQVKFKVNLLPQGQPQVSFKVNITAKEHNYLFGLPLMTVWQKE